MWSWISGFLLLLLTIVLPIVILVVIFRWDARHRARERAKILRGEQRARDCANAFGLQHTRHELDPTLWLLHGTIRSVHVDLEIKALDGCDALDIKLRGPRWLPAGVSIRYPALLSGHPKDGDAKWQTPTHHIQGIGFVVEPADATDRWPYLLSLIAHPPTGPLPLEITHDVFKSHTTITPDQSITAVVDVVITGALLWGDRAVEAGGV